MVSRRKILLGLTGVAGIVGVGGYLALKPLLAPEPAPIGFELKSGTAEKAKALLEKYPAVDVHSHPGRTFVDGAKDLAWKLKLYSMMGRFEDRAIADMIAGQMGSVVFSGVADFALLDVKKNGLQPVREFQEGEAWEIYRQLIENFNALIEAGTVKLVLNPDDIIDAHRTKIPGAILAMEGGDFLENDISRVKSAYDDGLRMLTLIHYHNNAIGDNMSDPLADGGLSEFGAEVVGEMNRMGMMIDLSHASSKAANEVMALATKPVCITHTHVNSSQDQHPRFVSEGLAKKVIDAGGIVGAWPAGIGITTLNGFIERIVGLVDKFGEEGIAIGADMDGNYKPVYGNFRQMPLIVGALIDRGIGDDTIAKIIGGNFIRVFNDNQPA